MSFVSITNEEKQEMLRSIGVDNISELFKDIPNEIKLNNLPDLPEPMSEIEINSHIINLSNKNKCIDSFIGAGAYRHYVPALVDELSGRSEFYTSYTPYQPEISQGTLTAIFEYQTMIAKLCKMELANASLYDGATALAEAVMMIIRGNDKSKVLVSKSIHPHYLDVLKTYCWAAHVAIEIIKIEDGVTDYKELENLITSDAGAIVIQNPNFFGCIEDINAVSTIAKKNEIKLIVVVNEALTLGLLKAPGELGADVVCGEAQSFGNYVGFGGPMLGFIATTKEFMRKIPGRLVGKTNDSDGKEAYVLTLQSREQHIRREKATSNICTNEGLAALRAVIYLSLVGNKLRELAILNHDLASYLKNKLIEKGLENVFNKQYFNEFVLKYKNIDSFIDKIKSRGFMPGLKLSGYFKEYEDCILCCATEMNSKDQIDELINNI